SIQDIDFAIADFVLAVNARARELFFESNQGKEIIRSFQICQLRAGDLSYTARGFLPANRAIEAALERSLWSRHNLIELVGRDLIELKLQRVAVGLDYRSSHHP